MGEYIKRGYRLSQNGQQVQDILDTVAANTAAIESLNGERLSLTEQVAANTASIEALNERLESDEKEIAANKESIESLETSVSSLDDTTDKLVTDVAANTTAIAALNSSKADKPLEVAVALDWATASSGDADATTTKDVEVPCHTFTSYQDCHNAIESGRAVIFKLYVGFDDGYDYMTFVPDDTSFILARFKAESYDMFGEIIDAYIEGGTAVESSLDRFNVTQALLRYNISADNAPVLNIRSIYTTDTAEEGSKDVMTSQGVYAAIKDAVHYEQIQET